MTDKKKAWLGQPHLFESLEMNFDEWVMMVCTHKMQGMPKFLIVIPVDNDDKVPAQDQNFFVWNEDDAISYQAL